MLQELRVAMGLSSWGERGGFCFVLKQFCEVFIDFVTLSLLCYVLGFWPRGMWDCSSLTRDRTCTLCIGRQSLNHWTTREVPKRWFWVHFAEYDWMVNREVTEMKGQDRWGGLCWFRDISGPSKCPQVIPSSSFQVTMLYVKEDDLNENKNKTKSQSSRNPYKEQLYCRTVFQWLLCVSSLCQCRRLEKMKM